MTKWKLQQVPKVGFIWKINQCNLPSEETKGEKPPAYLKAVGEVTDEVSQSFQKDLSVK